MERNYEGSRPYNQRSGYAEGVQVGKQRFYADSTADYAEQPQSIANKHSGYKEAHRRGRRYAIAEARKAQQAPPAVVTGGGAGSAGSALQGRTPFQRRAMNSQWQAGMRPLLPGSSIKRATAQVYPRRSV